MAAEQKGEPAAQMDLTFRREARCRSGAGVIDAK
ncbi:MAG: hypothetical protein ACI96P_002065 [Candidatus Azotimanducaceae bacterium]